MVLRKKIFTTSLLTLGLLVVGAGCGSSTSTESNKKTSATEITVPAEGVAGIYKGNLHTILPVVADLPKAYAPYEKSFGVKEDGKYVKNTTPSTTLGYQSTKLISSLTSKQGFSVSLTLQTFNDTASAVAYYNTVSTVNNTLYAEEKDSTVGILTGIGDAASYYTSAYTNQYDSNYNNITWNVTMVTSNLVTSFIIETPSTYTADELKSFLTQWTKKLTTYKQASDLEFQKELQQSDVK